MTTFPRRLYQIYSASMMPFDGSTENKLLYKSMLHNFSFNLQINFVKIGGQNYFIVSLHCGINSREKGKVTPLVTPSLKASSPWKISNL